MTLSVEQAFPVRTREELIAWFQEHRWEQHQAMFAHRHSHDPAIPPGAGGAVLVGAPPAGHLRLPRQREIDDC